MDIFEQARRDFLTDQEHAERRQRYFAKLGKDKSKAISQNDWSIQDHQDYLVCGYSDGQADFGIFKRKLLCCPAFWSLSGSAVKVLLMCCNEVYWNKPKKKTIRAKAGGRGQKQIKLPRQSTTFILPLNRLEAVGISRRTGIRAMKDLLKLGFVEILEKVHGKPTIYQLSEVCLSLSSIEVEAITGSAKMASPKKRSQAICEDTNRQRLSIVAI